MVELYMDEKWKLSKKGSKNGGSCSRRGGESSLKTSNAARRSFTRRCASLVKEQRARFYIMRRCVVMLVCWRDYQDC